MNTIIPTYIYTEMTPNPASLKFVADRMLIKHGELAEFNNANEASNSSKLIQGLFQFPFVDSVFVMSNFITINKNNTIDWEEVKEEMRIYIQKELMCTEFAVLEAQVCNTEEVIKDKITNSTTPVPSEYDEKIKGILQEYVRPAVEKDGGAIEYISYNDGIVTVALKGSCSGCPSATVTLKNGVESLLQSMIPQVQEVVALQM